MSTEQVTTARPPEVVAREHELARAYDAAKTLQARLEMLGDHEPEVRAVRMLRAALGTEILRLATEQGR
jgi:hypothetical protein